MNLKGIKSDTIENVTSLPSAGEGKSFSYVGEMIDFTLEKQLLDEETWKVFVDQFRLKSDGDGAWRGEYWGKMMRGGCMTYRAKKNVKLYDVLKNTVLDLLSTQEKSGRISSYPIEKEFSGWDMWARKYVLLGLLYFYEICKSETLKAKIRRGMMRHADYIVRKIGDGKNQTSIFKTTKWWGGLNSCSILEPFVRLYKLTNEKRYLDFSEYIVNSGFCEDMNIIELCLSQKLLPYQFKHTKAYEMASCFQGLLEYYTVVKDEKHLTAVKNFVEMVEKTDYTAIGCSGCTHELFDNSTEKQTEPAPEDIMQETCVTVTLMNLFQRLLTLTGEAKYAELLERSGFNALYGAVNNEDQTMVRAKAFIYTSGTREERKHEPFPFDSYSPLYMDRRAKAIGGWKMMQNDRSYGCCACIGALGTALMGLVPVTKGKDRLFVNLYTNYALKTELGGEKISIRIFANVYQKNGARITIDGGKNPFSLAVRIPTWAENFKAESSMGERPSRQEKGYLIFDGLCGKREIKISFSAPVKVRIRNGKIAFERGPIVLARDGRLGNIKTPVVCKKKDGQTIRAKALTKTPFSCNAAWEIKTGGQSVRLCDYAQAGKNYDDEDCDITVWQDMQ